MNDELSLEKQIEQIMKEFDWDRVYNTMQFLNWKWFHPVPDAFVVPSIPQLKFDAERYLRICYKHCLERKETYTSGSGGLMVRCEYFTDYPPILTLTFELAGTRFYHRSQDEELPVVEKPSRNIQIDL